MEVGYAMELCTENALKVCDEIMLGQALPLHISGHIWLNRFL